MSSIDVCLEHKPVKIYNDSTLREMIDKKYNINKINKLSIEERNKAINEIYNNTSISIRQLSRVLGMGKAIIENSVKQDKRNVRDY